MTVSRIDLARAKRKLDAGAVQMVDLRAKPAFLGWPRGQDDPGGHIHGAASLPASWLTGSDGHSWRPLEEIAEILRGRGLEGSREVVLYGAERDAGFEVAGLLQQLEYSDVSVLDMPFSSIHASDELPISRIPGYQRLVPADWLRRRLGAGQGRAGGQELPRLVEVTVASEGEGNPIPGALLLPIESLEEPPIWNRVAPEALRKVLAGMGIRAGETVVVYSANPMAAARAAVILLYAGVKDVRLLDGGKAAWQRAGYPTQSRPADPVPVADFGARVPANPGVIVDMEEAERIRKSGDGRLVSVRSWEEYVGKTSGYDYISPRGRIARAVWGYAGSGAHRLEHYRSPDGTLRNPLEIERLWRSQGIAPTNRVAFYCGTGWRASEAFWVALLLGWPRICVYDGGWYEWSMYPANPVASG